MQQAPFDVIIVGAGSGGVSAAHLLARGGLQVALIDQRARCTPCFKAEKIESEHAQLLRKFELLSLVRPVTARIQECRNVYRGTVYERFDTEIYGVAHDELVNLLREKLPPSVRFIVNRVESIESDPVSPGVTLRSGERLKARLVVLANGSGGKLHDHLGIEKRSVRKEHSLCFGFDIRREGGGAFDFGCKNFECEDPERGVGYVTFFRIRERMRANLFTYWSPKDPIARRVIEDPMGELAEIFTGFKEHLGDCFLDGKVHAYSIDLYQVSSFLKPGLVLIGDGFQNVCPSTSSGLGRVFTDVDVLCNECIPGWFSTPGTGVEKIAEFYDSPRKIANDHKAASSAEYLRNLALKRSLVWRLERLPIWRNFKDGMKKNLVGRSLVLPLFRSCKAIIRRFSRSALQDLTDVPVVEALS